MLTFLLTDVEGSTRLWESDPGAMREALARHDELVATTAAGHGGRVVKERGEGDSAFLVFARPTDAVACALELQGALGAEAWPEGAEVRVRMAVHTGEAEERGGDLYGAAVNRCARLRSAAHGGQVLVSGAVAELVAGTDAPWALRDLGSHRLRDLTRPERIFELTHPSLTAGLPPPDTLDAHPHNLPVQPNPLVGRTQELGDVTGLLRGGEARLVTVTGPGGMGKTRLAVQAGAELTPFFHHGVWLVELAEVTDPVLVASAVARSFDLKEERGRTFADVVGDYLREKELLLVVDNFEQVVEGAEFLGGLLTRVRASGWWPPAASGCACAPSTSTPLTPSTRRRRWPSFRSGHGRLARGSG